MNFLKNVKSSLLIKLFTYCNRLIIVKKGIYMKKTFLLIILFIFTISLSAQTYKVLGQVIDSTSRQPLVAANIQLIELPDSMRRGKTSDNYGNFVFENIKPGKYHLKITYIGYKSFKNDFTLTNKSIDFQKIFLAQTEVSTKEVQIVDKLLPVVQKGDTSEYQADAFKTRKDASAEELVSKMPGISVQDGKVQAQGEEVKRVLVDGRPFFGDNPMTVLRNIPAEVIDRIQVFDQQSEQAQFTGFNDGNTSKAMNVMTRNRMQQGTFGNFQGGYGTTERFKAGGNFNHFNNDQRISIIAQTNNVNEQNFSPEDILGVMGGGRGGMGGGGMRVVTVGSGGGMRGGGGGDRGGGFVALSGGGGGFSGGDMSQFLVGAMNGLTKTHALGLNYSDKWNNNFEINGSYFLNFTGNDAESYLKRQYILTANDGQIYNESNFSKSNNINHRLNFRTEYQIDSLNSILFRPRLSIQNNDGNSTQFGNTYTSLQNLNAVKNKSGSDLSAINTSAELLYRHRFETKGRTFSLSLNGSYNQNDGNNNLFSESIYFTNLLMSDTLDQNSDYLKKGYGTSFNLVYTEPISEISYLQLNAGYNYTTDKSDKQVFQKELFSNTYSILDTTLSNVYNKEYKTQSYGAGYRWEKNEISINANLNYNISTLSNDQTFPYKAKVEKSFNSILPSVMFRYNVSRDNNIRFFYRTFNNSPSVEQLQNVLNNNNPVQLSIGNPSLKQDYRHFFSLNYSKINFQTYQTLFVIVGGSIASDYIGNHTIIANRDTTVKNIFLNRGTQLTMPENLDGYYNIRSFVAYGMPVEFVKSNLNLTLSIGYTRTPGLLNSQTNFSNNYSYGLGFVLASNFSPELDFTISSNGNYTVSKNSLRTSNDNNYFTLNSYLKFFWLLMEGFTFQTDLRHIFDQGLTAGYNKNSYLWNVSIGKKIFSNNSGEIKLSVYDLLNQNTNTQRNVYDFYYEDTRSNVLGRYIMLSFVYQLRAF
jgi:hypothetical protein